MQPQPILETRQRRVASAAAAAAEKQVAKRSRSVRRTPLCGAGPQQPRRREAEAAAAAQVDLVKKTGGGVFALCAKGVVLDCHLRRRAPGRKGCGRAAWPVARPGWGPLAAHPCCRKQRLQSGLLGASALLRNARGFASRTAILWRFDQNSVVLAPQSPSQYGSWSCVPNHVVGCRGLCFL